MARLSLSLLGPFQAALDGESIVAFGSNKVRALLAYLAVEADRPHSREKLAGLLWPERSDQDASASLRYALSNLRAAIGDRAPIGDRALVGNREASPPFLLISRQTIQFNLTSDTWVDVAAFTELSASLAPSLSDLERAVDLYRGGFLEGFSVSDSAPFEEWALLQREQLHRQALSALRRLAAIYGQRGEYERALPYARRQVELEPWQEKAQRQLMRLLAADGQRGAALAQYEACQRVLAQELGVEPARATAWLYEQIRAGEFEPERVEIQPMAPEAGGAATPTIGAPALAPRPSAWQRLSKWRWAFVGGLLLLATAVAFFLANRVGLFEKASSQPPLLPSPVGAVLMSVESLLVDLCEKWHPRPAGDESPPQICVGDHWGYRVRAVTEDLEFRGIGRLVWSPDGQQIAFQAQPYQSDSHIYIINADGSALRQVTEGSDCMPAWSPDGQWIAFVRWGADLWLVRPDGAEAHMLLATGALPTREVVWSPDSQQIAFLRAAADVGFPRDEIWIINRDGSDPCLLHSPERPAGAEVKLAWSPDGAQVGCFFVRAGSEGSGLLINADGSGEPQATEEYPVWWFPDRWPLWGEER